MELETEKFIKNLAGNAIGKLPFKQGEVRATFGMKKKIKFFSKKLQGIKKALLLQPRSRRKIDEKDGREKD